MAIANNNLVFSFVVGLDFTHTQRDCVGVSIGEELEATPFDDLSHALGR